MAAPTWCSSRPDPSVPIGVVLQPVDVSLTCSYNVSMNDTTIMSGSRSSVGVRELKNQLSGYLERVKAGEEITVTQHGTPIARLSAIGAEADARQVLIELGIIVPARNPSRRLPKQRVKMAPGPSIVELVAEQRR